MTRIDCAFTYFVSELVQKAAKTVKPIGMGLYFRLGMRLGRDPQSGRINDVAWMDGTPVDYANPLMPGAAGKR